LLIILLKERQIPAPFWHPHKSEKLVEAEVEVKEEYGKGDWPIHA
jgi:hypothetical protein